MTLDQAIQHYYDKAQELAGKNSSDSHIKDSIQIAHWLEELKRLRSENESLRRDIGSFL